MPLFKARTWWLHDEVIQFIAERELEAKVKETNAEGNDHRHEPFQRRNTGPQSALSTTPTSTMSIRLRTEESGPSPTPSAGFYLQTHHRRCRPESGAVSPSDLHCGGSMQVGARYLVLPQTQATGTTFYEVIQNSCNIGFVQI